MAYLPSFLWIRYTFKVLFCIFFHCRLPVPSRKEDSDAFLLSYTSVKFLWLRRKFHLFHRIFSPTRQATFVVVSFPSRFGTPLIFFLLLGDASTCSSFLIQDGARPNQLCSLPSYRNSILKLLPQLTKLDGHPVND